ncbi:hypothetical protein BCR39DRAFT_535357 [Naematelia encephala]|uniref:GTP cyclohydrolase 1 n=1 Tax=Naematelia encephala TaxID=71784 RepID=A0A1Y2B1D6_9TREE|nr:hypothetical protein BCR39DRAFT_535357 [Naematelia encephala]
MPSQQPKTSPPASKIPRPTSSPKAIPSPTPNLHTLHRLSESSTGDWERGGSSANARSPPSDTHSLRDYVKGKGTAAAAALPNLQSPLRQTSPQIHLPPRYPRDGYGFRPASGQSTPTSQPSASPLSNANMNPSSASTLIPGFSPYVAVPDASYRNGGGDDEDLDHIDRTNMEDLRDEVRGELVRMDGSGPEVQVGNLAGGGIADEEGLGWPAKSTKARMYSSPQEKAANIALLSSAIRTVLECIGEDPNREGLQRTPERYAKALMWMTKGYEERLVDVINDAIFAENHDEMVIVRDIDVFSLCEHHMVPFTGKISIGYIPNKLVLGLSKLARIAETFSRRLQVQERLTKQVALAVEEAIRPRGVAVVMEATHMCMSMRGVQKPGASTVTSTMLGCFRQQQKTRDEFLTLIRTPSIVNRF